MLRRAPSVLWLLVPLATHCSSPAGASDGGSPSSDATSRETGTTHKQPDGGHPGDAGGSSHDATSKKPDGGGHPDGGGASKDAAPTGDAGPSDAPVADAHGGSDSGAEAGLVAACPAAPPANNDDCTTPIECEYGSDPAVACDTTATCMNATWSVNSPATPCRSSSVTCPATYAGVTGGQACAPDAATCVYPQERCDCTTACGETLHANQVWCCGAEPGGGTSCPTVRPRIGSSCDMDAGINCDYGVCSGNVMLFCSGGSWQVVTGVHCPG